MTNSKAKEELVVKRIEIGFNLYNELKKYFSADLKEKEAISDTCITFLERGLKSVEIPKTTLELLNSFYEFSNKLPENKAEEVNKKIVTLIKNEYKEIIDKL